MEWEKTFENYMFDERLISKIYNELLQINSKNTKNLIKITNTQGAKERNRYFSKKETQMANKYMNR